MSGPSARARVPMTVIIALAMVASLVVAGGSPSRAQTPTGRPQADIVFVVDESGSMGSSQSHVRTRLRELSQDLIDEGIDLRLGLLGYTASPRVLSPLTDDLDAFQSALGQLRTWGGLERGFLAVHRAMQEDIGHRPEAGTCAILIADEDADVSGGNGTKQAALDAMATRDAVFLGVVNPRSGNTRNDYGPNPGSLAEQTGGVVFDIADFRNDATPVLEAVLDACLEATEVLVQPTADAGGDQTVTEGDTVVLDGSASSTPADAPLTYRWEITGQDGPVVTLSSRDGVTSAFRTLDDGTYRVQLTVDDGRGQDTDEVTITVRNADPAMAAVADPAYADGVALVTAQFTDTGWVDGHTASIDWGDGTLDEGIEPSAAGVGWGSLFGTHVYDEPGSYDVTVSLVDDDGGVDRAQVTLSVQEGVALWANSRTVGTSLDWTSGSVVVEGRTHSNGDLRIRGSDKYFTGSTTYSGQLDAKSASFDPAPVQVEPSDYPIRFELADHRPGGRAAVEAGSAYHDQTAACAAGGGTWHVVGTELPSGVHYAPCDVKLNGQPVGGTITLAAEGTIDVSGNGVTFDPYLDGLLFLSGASTDRAVKLASSDSTYFGYVFAETGEVELSGSGNDFFCGILADRLDFSGQDTRVRGTGCLRPERTATPPVLVPAVTTATHNSTDVVAPGAAVTHDVTVSNDGASLLITGVVGAENLDDAPVTVTGHDLGLEQLVSGRWGPLDGDVATTIRAEAASGVTYPDDADDPITGTVIEPGGLASWGVAIRVEFDAAAAATLLGPDGPTAVRNVAELVVDPAAAPVRQLFRLGHDLAPELRALGADVEDVTVEVLTPSAGVRSFGAADVAELARLAPGDAVTVSTDTAVPVQAPRSEDESSAAYLARLAATDGSPLRAAGFAFGTGGIGRLVGAQTVATTELQVPRVQLALDGPSAIDAGATIELDARAANPSRATATGVVTDAEVVGRGPVTLTGMPDELAPGAAVTATGAVTVAEDETARELVSRASSTWRDANGNAYGPVEAALTTTVLAPGALDVVKTGEVVTTEDGREAVRYQITVSNSGDEPLEGVLLSDPMGAYTTLLAESVVVTSGTTSGAGTVDDPLVVNFGTLPGGASEVLLFDVTVDRPLPDGVAEIANQATVVAEGVEPVVSDDPQEPGAADPTVVPVRPDANTGTVEPDDPSDPTDPTDPGSGGGTPTDPDAPRPQIGAVGPQDASVVTVPVPITAAFTAPPGEEITAWRVAYRRVGGERTVQLASGVGDPTAASGSEPEPVSALTLATTATDETDAVELAEFDPTVVANGTYHLYVVATSSGGGTQVSTTSLVVDGGLKLGRFSSTYRDLLVPVAGLPVEVRRSYDSIDDTTGDFGVGWDLEVADVSVSVNRPPGYLGWRQEIRNCSLVFCEVHYASDIPHVVTITWPDGRQELFDLTPAKGSTFYRWLTTAAFTGRPGTTSKLEVAGDATLSYLDDGNLYGGFVGEDGVFDPQRFRLTTKDGTVYLLDRDTGVVSITEPNGERITFGSGGITSTSGPGVTFARDTRGRITRIEGPDGAAVTYGYDTAGDLVSVTDPAGHETTYTYEDHRLVAVDGPDGGALASYVYEDGRLVAVVDAAGNRTAVSADVDGRQETVTTADGRRTTVSTFDDRGNLIALEELFDGERHVTTFAYDDHDRLTRRTDALGRTWSAAYEDGNLIRLTEPGDRTTRISYHALGLPETITDPLGHTSTFEYDTRGNLLRSRDPSGAEVTYTYGDRGLRTTRTDAAGTTTWSYDPAGQVSSVVDAEGGETTFQRDDAGRPTTLTDARGGVTTFGYDPRGMVTAVTGPEGGTSRWTYDQRGRLTATTAPDGATTTYGYDALDRLVTVTDALARTTERRYDVVGNLTEFVDPTAAVTAWTYDGAGRSTSVTDPTGRTTTTDRDAVGRIVRTTDPAGRVTTANWTELDQLDAVSTPSGTRRYRYDDAGRLTAESDALGNTVGYAYDAAGRVTGVTDPRGATTTYEYDGAGRLSRLVDALGEEVAFEHDGLGNLVELTDPRGLSRTWQRDALGNATVATDPATGTTTTAWDLAGRPTSTTDARGVTVGFAFDDVGRITRVQTPDGAITHGYDAAGRRTSMTDATGTTRFQYDAADRLVEVAAPQGTVTYGYDAAGRRTALGYPSGATTSYDYDAAGDLSAVVDSLAGRTDVSWDGAGRLSQVARPNGVRTTYGYDAADRLVDVSHDGSTGEVASFSYTLDEAGNRVAVDGPDGTSTFELDALNRLTDARTPAADRSYTYDAVGNRLSETVDGVTDSYTYDAVTGLLTDAGGVPYGYDAAGNVIAAGDDRYSWDWAGRLTAAQVDGRTSTATYDGDGVRTGLDGRAQLYDRAGGLPQLIGDGTERFLHLAGPLAAIDGTGVSWLHGDALGSVSAVTDLAGAVTGTASYTPFGAPTSTGTSTPFGFAGEVQAASGLVHLRARTLDPSLGAFLSADSVQPGGPGTQGYNRYSYASNNPTSWTDPSGHTTLMEYSVSMAVTSTLVGAAFGGTFAFFLNCGGPGQADLACVLRGAAAGAVGGFVGGIPGLGGLGLLGVAALSGAAESTVAQLLEGGGVDPLQVGTDGLLSALTAGLLDSYLSRHLRDINLGTHLDEASPAGLPNASHLPATGETLDGLDDLAARRGALGAAPAGPGVSPTLSRLDVEGMGPLYGTSGHGRPVSLTVNPISRTHAETDVLQQLADVGGAGGGRATLYIDHPGGLCGACGRSGAVGSMARQVGISELSVIWPGGRTVIIP